MFPCRPIPEIQKRLSADMLLDAKQKKKSVKTLKHCPACAVKALAQCYWGNRDLDASGEPAALPLSNPELLMVHSVDNMLRRFTPGAGAGNAQEDPEEMQTRLLKACLESVDYT